MPRKRRRSRRPSTPVPHSPAWDEIHPTLDLHGETADSARHRTERWLRECSADGLRTVRVITGRGLHSAGLPVLPGEIGALLATLRGELVESFGTEPGGGVFRIVLRRIRQERPPLPRRPAPAPRGSDAELRRRAEEALSELGIRPTPALLEAEIQRIRAERERQAG